MNLEALVVKKFKYGFLHFFMTSFSPNVKGSNLGMIFLNGTDQIFKKFVGASIFFLEYLLTLNLSTYHTIAFYSVF